MKLARVLNLLLLAATIPLLAVQGSAHGDLHDQIEAVTAEIARRPKRAELYLKRADLRRLHREFSEALSDYESALRLDASLKGVHLGRAFLFLETGRQEEALTAVDTYLASVPRDSRALLLRARIFAAMHRSRDAAEQFRAVLPSASDADPDLYLEYARARLAAEGPGGGAAAIDEGIGRFGPIVSLISWAIETELRHGRADAAIARLESLPVALQRMPHWLLRKAEILFSSAHYQQAGDAYCNALVAMRSAPPRRRSVPQHQQQERQILLKIEELRADCVTAQSAGSPPGASTDHGAAPE